jgi:uncharacterized protein
MTHAARIRAHHAAPHFRELTSRECEMLLRRATVGRLAFSLHDKVDIEPIHFAYRSGWVVFRTAPGAKLDVLRQNRWVALEADEVNDVFEWQSVVVYGAAYPLDETVWHTLPHARERAMRLLRRIVPESGTPNDPTPSRDRVFHVQVIRMTGRAAMLRSVSAGRR